MTDTLEFKRKAVRLMESSEKPSSEVARELGVRRNQLFKWKEQLDKRGAGAFPGKGRGGSQGDEVARLRRLSSASSSTWDYGRRSPPREVRRSLPQPGPGMPPCH